MRTEQLYSIFKESTGITTDSRQVKEGQVFFALWGGNHNGNEYAADALAKGASWVVVDDPAFETGNAILVDDCLLELQALALHHRRKLNISVIAITGSNGKTTTKELLAAVLSKKYRVHYTRGNLNNHIGVPLTILSAASDTQMMIIELGANHIGEIRTLCSIARPDYGIITNISPAHIEGFGSFEGVVKAKTELFEFLKSVNGVALYNDRNPLLAERIFRILNRAVPFSDPSGTELNIEIVPSDLNLKLLASFMHRTYNITTNLFGRYNIENVRAAIAVGLFFEVDMQSIVEAIESYQPSNNRSEVRKTESNTLICDSYNANPASMLLAIESFMLLKAKKKVLILGDMLEMGEKSEEEHMKILARLESYEKAEILLVGPVFGRAERGKDYKFFLDVNSLADYLKDQPITGAAVLLKGSRGIGLEKVYSLL